MAELLEVELGKKTFNIPREHERLKNVLAFMYLKRATDSFKKTAMFWGSVYLLLQLIKFDIITLIFGLYFLSFAFLTRKSHSMKLYLYQSVIILIIAVLNIFLTFHGPSWGSRILWFSIALIQLAYSADLIWFYLKNKTQKAEPVSAKILKDLKGLINAIFGSNPSRVSNLFEFVSYGAFKKTIKVLVCSDEVFMVNSMSRQCEVTELKDLVIEKKKKKFLQKKFDVLVSAPDIKYYAVIKIRDFEKFESLKAEAVN